MNDICGILELKQRTAFRRIERAFENLTEALNNSKYYNKLVSIMNGEDWIQDIKHTVKERRLAFKCNEVEC